MTSSENRFNWRIGYAIFCVAYAGVVMYLGLDNFDKVHSEYRWARERSQPAQIVKIAHQELVDQCRRKYRRDTKRSDRYRENTSISSTEAEDPCFSWPESVLEERRITVAERLETETGKLKRKIIVFYISFGIFFLILPLVILYWLLALFIWIFKDMKFLK